MDQATACHAWRWCQQGSSLKLGSCKIGQVVFEWPCGSDVKHTEKRGPKRENLCGLLYWGSWHCPGIAEVVLEVAWWQGFAHSDMIGSPISPSDLLGAPFCGAAHWCLVFGCCDSR